MGANSIMLPCVRQGACGKYTTGAGAPEGGPRAIQPCIRLLCALVADRRGRRCGGRRPLGGRASPDAGEAEWPATGPRRGRVGAQKDAQKRVRVKSPEPKQLHGGATQCTCSWPLGGPYLTNRTDYCQEPNKGKRKRERRGRERERKRERKERKKRRAERKGSREEEKEGRRKKKEEGEQEANTRSIYTCSHTSRVQSAP